MPLRKLFNRLIRYLSSRLNHRQQIYMLSFVVGLCSGLAAVLLKYTVHWVHRLVSQHHGAGGTHLLYLALPMAGILATLYFVRYLVRDEMGHGITKVLHAISKKGGFLKPHNQYSSVVASTLTVGFGGSVGLESPIVVTGASIGSNLGRVFGMNYKSVITLIGCGAAGAIAGIFKAPIAGVLFGLEVLMLDISIWSIVPLLISAVTGASISYFFLDRGVTLQFPIAEPFSVVNLPGYMLLGVLTGLVSVYFTRSTMKLENLFGRVRSAWNRLMIGGVVLGALIFLLPPLYGEGYTMLNLLLDGNLAAISSGSFFAGTDNFYWMITFFFAAGSA